MRDFPNPLWARPRTTRKNARPGTPHLWLLPLTGRAECGRVLLPRLHGSGSRFWRRTPQNACEQCLAHQKATLK